MAVLSTHLQCSWLLLVLFPSSISAHGALRAPLFLVEGCPDGCNGHGACYHGSLHGGGAGTPKGLRRTSGRDQLVFPGDDLRIHTEPRRYPRATL